MACHSSLQRMGHDDFSNSQSKRRGDISRFGARRNRPDKSAHVARELKGRKITHPFRYFAKGNRAVVDKNDAVLERG